MIHKIASYKTGQSLEKSPTSALRISRGHWTVLTRQIYHCLHSLIQRKLSVFVCHSLSRHKASWTTNPASDWWAGPLLRHGNVKKFCSDLKKPWLDLENRNSLSHSQDALKVYSFLLPLEWPTLGSYSDSSETHIILNDISRHDHQSRPGIQHSTSPHHTHQAVCEPSEHVWLLLIRVRYSWRSIAVVFWFLFLYWTNLPSWILIVLFLEWTFVYRC